MERTGNGLSGSLQRKTRDRWIGGALAFRRTVVDVVDTFCLLVHNATARKAGKQRGLPALRILGPRGKGLALSADQALHFRDSGRPALNSRRSRPQIQ